MFVCEKCHNTDPPCPYTIVEEILFSYGRCEVCGEIKKCYDCHAHHNKHWLDEYVKKVKEKKEKE